MYVAIEGIDTAGKSTQIELLRQKFPRAIFTCEPGGTELGVSLRKILLESDVSLDGRSELFLFLADRVEHIAKVIQPHRHELIISDRSLVSGIAYAKDFDFDLLLSLNRFAVGGVLPDCLVLLELSPQELRRRLDSKKQDKIEQRGVEFLLQIQERMLLAASSLGLDCVRIDAGLGREEIHARILQLL